MTRKDFEFEITAEDIVNGVRGDCWQCAAALAFKRALGVSLCSVGRRLGAKVSGRKFPMLAMPTFDDGRMLIILPQEVEKFVVDFDAGRPVSPFKFVLNLLDGAESRSERRAEFKAKRAEGYLVSVERGKSCCV
jgi:hypothetical protein